MILNSVSVLPARRCRQQCSLALVCLSDCQVRGEPPRGAGPPAWEEGCLWRAEAAAAAPLWLRVIPSRSARRTVYPSGVPTARRRGHRASWEETCWRDRWVTPTRRFYSVTLECSRPVGDKRPFVNMRRTTHVKNILWVKGCICVAELLRSRSCFELLHIYATKWAFVHLCFDCWFVVSWALFPGRYASTVPAGRATLFVFVFLSRCCNIHSLQLARVY